jgi:pantoate--beta-alanine ligase
LRSPERIVSGGGEQFLRIVERIADLNIPADKKVGFVPTMGAFHQGHLELMRKAKAECDFSIASLFVNPLQFGPTEDFAKYPRDIESDASQSAAFLDVLFAPIREEVYPSNFSSTITVAGVSERWEGAHRPGHFDGVATVVAKLFNIVKPSIAYFGRKDFQQCAIIQKMVRDLNMSIDISIEPTVREQDGLAMSSRNKYLSPEERSLAPIIYKTLNQARDSILGEIAVDQVLSQAKAALRDSGFLLDYFAYVDNDTLLPISTRQPSSTLICAAKLGNTRLIDNIEVA